MEMETGMSTSVISTCNYMSSSKMDEEDDVPLPGFRFHPTDEELVGFYLKRKVEKRPISIELIKPIDIYKFDPWDLPKASNVGEKEWYFFCKRGRKYRNSIRPNRVTGSGFWKATGIDRPIYSAAGTGAAGGGEGSRDSIIGLKKSLVYYRGSAGKGTKTDWMMHEFRLPSEHEKSSSNTYTTKHNIDAKDIAHEAEVWTLCRIFKRSVSFRKCIPEWKESSSGGSSKLQKTNNAYHHDLAISTSKTCSNNIMDLDHHQYNYISFRNNTSTHNPNNTIPSALLNHHSSKSSIVDKKPYNNINLHGQADILSNYHHQQQQQQLQQNKLFFSQLSSSATSISSSAVTPPVPTLLSSNNSNTVASNHNHYYHGSIPSSGSMDFSEFLKNGDWDELRSLFECGAAASATVSAPAAPMFL